MGSNRTCFRHTHFRHMDSKHTCFKHTCFICAFGKWVLIIRVLGIHVLGMWRAIMSKRLVEQAVPILCRGLGAVCLNFREGSLGSSCCRTAYQPSLHHTDKQMAAPTVSDENVSKALKRLGEDPDNEEMQHMYMALRKTKQRVNPEEWNTFKKRKQYMASLSRVVLVVPRHNEEATAYFESRPQFLLDPCALEQMPPNIDPSSVFFADSGCNRESLGPGVLEWKTSVSLVATKLLSKTLAPDQHRNQHKALTQEAEPAPDHNASASGLVPTAPGTAMCVHAAAPPKRPLLVGDSDPADPSQKVDYGEEIARSTKEPADKGIFLLPDRNSPHSVEFWLRQYATHVPKVFSTKPSDQELDAFAKNLPAYLRRYCGFVGKCMEGHPIIEQAPALTVHFKTVQVVYPPFVPKKVCAIIALADYPIGDLTDPPLELDLTLEEKLTFMKCALYQDWADSHFIRKVSNLARADQGDEVKLEGARKLHGYKPSGAEGERVHAELELAVTVLGPAGRAVKIQYLCGDASRFTLLRKWSSRNPLIKIGLLMVAEPSCTAAEFVEAVELFVDADRSAENGADAKSLLESCQIPNDVVKGLLKLDKAMLSLQPTSEEIVLVSRLLLELSAHRLGFNLPAKLDPSPVTAEHKNLTSFIEGLVSAMFPLRAPTEFPNQYIAVAQVLQVHGEIVAAENAQRAADKTKHDRQKSDAQKVESKPGGDEKKGDVVEDVARPAPTFALQQVVEIFGMSKSVKVAGIGLKNCNGLQGRVTKVLSKDLRIEFLEAEGQDNVAGIAHDFRKENCKVVGEEPVADGGAASSLTAQSEAAKANGDALANELFGQESGKDSEA